MAITDLTGTKWRFKEPPIFFDEAIKTDFSLNYTIKSLTEPPQFSNFTKNKCRVYSSATKVWFYTRGEDVTYPFVYVNPDNYTTSGYRMGYQGSASAGSSFFIDDWSSVTMEIEGGSDVTNVALISWMQANLEQIIDGYSITYHANGGTPEPENLTGQTNLPSTLPTVSKPNFTFDGWYTDSTFTTPAVAGAEISADTDLYAKFTRTTIILDLSTIGLPEGTHSIQMKLSDDGVTKADSELSNAVVYTVSSWEYPTQDGDELTITQAYSVEQDGDTLYIE